MIRRFLSRLVSSPSVYDSVQRAAGVRHIRGRLSRHLKHIGSDTVLDVGAGTGGFADLVPVTGRYIWLDNDEEKLRGYLEKRGSRLAALADATALCFESQSIGVALCVNTSHHLDDVAFASLLAELRRVVKRKLIFVDALRCPSRLLSRVLWSCDRGTCPRTSVELRAGIETSFAIQVYEEFELMHRYVLCIAEPRTTQT